MSHTPTPWELEVTHFAYPPNQAVLMRAQDYARAKVCVNACEGMEDPWADILAMSTDLSVGKSIMDEKDTEIAELKARVKELEQWKGWISINDYMPVMLVTVKVKNAAGEECTAFRSTHSEAFKDSNGNILKSITHWMPIINPPKPQQ